MALSKGAEMAITQGLKLAMMAAGIKPEQIEADVLRMVSAVLSWDERLGRIEECLGIVPKPQLEHDDNGETTVHNEFTGRKLNGHG